jgi:hypothetical protein
MSIQLSAHNVTAIRLEDRTHDHLGWISLSVVSTDPYSGTETEFVITAFPADKTKPLRVEQPDEVSA